MVLNESAAMTDSLTIVLPNWAMFLVGFVFLYPWGLWLKALHAAHEERMIALSARGVIQQLEVMNMMYRHIDENAPRPAPQPPKMPPPPPPPPASTDPSVRLKG